MCFRRSTRRVDVDVLTLDADLSDLPQKLTNQRNPLNSLLSVCVLRDPISFVRPALIDLTAGMLTTLGPSFGAPYSGVTK